MGDPVTDTIHQELCTAIAELAKSVDRAVKRMAIRAKVTAAIADAKKAEEAAEAFLAAALQGHQGHRAPTVKTVTAPKAATRPQLPERDNIVVIEELDTACRWLSEVTAPAAPPPKPDRKKNESAFAVKLLELHDRTGGFLKSHSDEKAFPSDAALTDT